MTIQTLITNAEPQIEVIVDGDLNIEGWSNPEIKAVALENTLQLQEKDERYVVRAENDATLYVPAGAIVNIKRVGGDMDARNLAGKLAVQAVGGDLRLQRSAGLEVISVGGDCDLRTIQGPVLVETVGGDLLGLDLQDNVSAGKVGGDAELEITRGDLSVHAGGDVQAALLAPGEGGVVIHAGGDVELHFAPGVGLSLAANCGSNDIDLDFNGQHVNADSANIVQTIGDGRVNVTVQAGGDVELTDRPWDLTRRYQSFDAADERWNQWQERMQQHEETLRLRMDEIARRTSQASRKIEERVQAAMRRVEQRRGGWPTPIPPAVPVAPAAPREARVSEEERAVILKMLQDKKINAEEAERLLEALEGHE